MATNLLDSLKGLITPDLLSKAAGMLGESEGATSKALGTVFPTVLSGLLNKSQDAGAMETIFGLLKDKANDGSILTNVGSLLGADAKEPINALGDKFLSSLFGDKVSSLAGMIGNIAGIKNTSASSILSMAGPLVMGVLGDVIKKNGLNLAGLLKFLGSQKDSIIAAAPQALAGILGLGNLKNLGANLLSGTADTGKKGTGWVWPLIIILAVILLLWYLLRGCGGDKPAAAIDSLAVKSGEVAQTLGGAADKLGAFFKKALPTNVELNIPEFGIENALLKFIEDADKVPDKTTWFNFDRLVFQTGSATLDPQSQEQLTNIVEILKAFPAVKVKIGGYTDNVGDPAANMTLSRDRSTNVMNE
ncbi:MAG TPA: DUF937 domain-containing protein, partial [Bacteroidota bacterium]|nr:DUF937 domain-containing protein [Bacteroidota bacterium]